MGIDVNRAGSQRNQMSRDASALKELQRNLGTFRGNLNNVWQGEEMSYVNLAIAHLIQELTRCSSSLEALSNDIQSTAQEIRLEETTAEQARQRQLTQQAQQVTSWMRNTFR